MEFPSNRLKDIYDHYLHAISRHYDAREAIAMIAILFESLVGLPKTKIMSEPDLRMSESEILKIHKAILKLLDDWPLQYITGETEFYDCKIRVKPGVLIPRPETEELVHWVILDYTDRQNKLKILDIGTGSGCIAIALKKKFPLSEVFAIDISDEAMKTAHENAELNQVEIHFSQMDILNDSVENFLPGGFDLILSNPPYIRNSERKLMKANVLKYEPSMALFVPDTDSLLFYHAIIEKAKYLLKENGAIYFEINEYMQEQLDGLKNEFPQFTFTFKKDLNEKFRMLKLVFRGTALFNK